MKKLLLFIIWHCVAYTPCWTQSAELFFGDTLFVEPGETFAVELRGNHLQQIATFQFTLAWDANLLTLTDVEEILPSGMVLLAAPSTVQILWADPTGQGQSIPDSSAMVRLQFIAGTTQPVTTLVQFANQPFPTEFYQIISNDVQLLPVNTQPAPIVIRQCQTTIDLGPAQYLCPDTSTVLQPICTGCSQFTWPDGSNAATFQVDQAGWVWANAQGPLRCFARDSVEIIAAPRPDLQLPPSATLCGMDTVQLIGASSSTNLQYEWSTGQNQPLISVSTPGIYSLIVRNDAGCTRVAVATVTQNTAPQVPIVFTQPDCDQPTGSIQFEPTGVGANSFLFSVDSGQTLQSSAQFPSLSPGTYYPTVEDPDGCLFVLDSVALRSPLIPEIDITESQITLQEGTEVQIEASIGSFPLEAVASVQWLPDSIYSFPGLSPEDRLKPLVKPLDSGWHYVQLQSKDGCTVKDSIFIVLQSGDPLKMYIPNVITTASENGNDKLVVMANDERILRIKHFSIFDRWGSIVFEQRNFLPNDVSSGWDGRATDKMADAGVYIWRLETELLNGKTDISSGNITLVK